MSRSKRKAIIKDKPRNVNRAAQYWQAIRSRTNTAIRSCDDLEELEIPDPKTIVNDYDYCDYVVDYEHKIYESRYCTASQSLKERKKYSRK